MAQERRLMNIGEVALYLGVHHESVRRMARQGKLPGHKLSKGPKGEWRFRQEDIDRAIFGDEEANET